MRRALAFLLLLPVLALAACGEERTGGRSETAEATPSATAEGGCQAVEAPAPKPDGGAEKPSGELDAAKTWTVTVKTSCGDFAIGLDVKQDPKTASSFASLARQGFYDRTVFHRIVPGFVIQGGDPTQTGTGGPGYSVEEAPPQDTTYTRGVVAMAKTGAEPAGTSGSQFYVVTGEDAGLPPDYAVAGRVSGGQDVVDLIDGQGTPGADGPPQQPVVITSATVTER